MKRKFTILSLFVVLLFGLFMFGGCKNNEPSEGEGLITVQVVDFAGKDLFNKEIKFGTGDTLVGLLKDNKKIKMTGETSEYGFYVISLCGVAASNEDQTYWSLEVNDEYSMVGVSDIVLVDGDKISFLLIGW